MTHFILIIAKHNFLLKWIVSVELFCLRDKGREITVKNVLPHLKNIIVLQAVHYSVCDFLLFLPPTARAKWTLLFAPELDRSERRERGANDISQLFPLLWSRTRGHILFSNIDIVRRLRAGAALLSCCPWAHSGLYYHRQVSPGFAIFANFRILPKSK